MIRTQHSLAAPDKMLVGSDLPSRLAARRELEQWIGARGYRLARAGARRLSVFEQGALVREWMIVERAPARKRFWPFAFLTSRRHTENNANVAEQPEQEQERDAAAAA